MKEIWFTADQHFGHTNMIKHADRPFETVKEMDEVLIKNWNKCVKKGDTVYFLGDFAWRNVKEYLAKLNGQIHWVRGNHDKRSTTTWLLKQPQIISVDNLKQIKIDSTYITLCHYALRTWNMKQYDQWHLFGHSHGRMSSFGKSFDVGVDCHGFRPISFEEVKTTMRYL